MDSDETPLWYKTAIFYEVSVKSFKDSSGNGIGDIKGLTSKLDYLHELGVTCLWLLPFYPSPWKDDGYDVADFYDIAPEVGTMDDFDKLLEEADKRNIRIIIDFVSNHTSDQHPWFQESRKSKDNPYRDYYVWSDTDEKYKDVRVIFNDYHDSNWTYDEQTDQYYWHRFFDHQPDLNYDNPKVHEEIFQAMEFWMDKGIAGFRVDAIPYLYEREGTSCENLPETHEFLKKMRKRVDNKYGENEKIMLCESNMWQEDTMPYFGNKGDEFQMAFDFPIMPRIYEAVARQDTTPMHEILDKHHDFDDSRQWATFLRNHDELTLEKVTDEVREWMWNYYTKDDPRAKINLGIRRRLAPLMKNDRRKIELLNVFLLSLPGSPIIYYGDEIGMGDDLSLDDRNGVRTPMQWNDGKNAGFSEAETENLVFPVIQDDVYGYQHVNVESQQDDEDSLLNWTKHMIALRREHEYIGYAVMELITFEDSRIIGMAYQYNSNKLITLFNFSEERINLKFNVDNNSFRELISGKDLDLSQNSIKMKPYGYMWLQ